MGAADFILRRAESIYQGITRLHNEYGYTKTWEQCRVKYSICSLFIWCVIHSSMKRRPAKLYAYCVSRGDIPREGVDIIPAGEGGVAGSTRGYYQSGGGEQGEYVGGQNPLLRTAIDKRWEQTS